MNSRDDHSEQSIRDELTRAAGAFAPPPGLKSQTWKRLERAGRAGRARGRRVMVWAARLLAPAAAAAVLIAVTVVWLLPGGNGHTAYADEVQAAIGATKAAKCLRAQVRMADGTEGVQWIGCKPQRMASKNPDGLLTYYDDGAGREYVYHPRENVIYIDGYKPPAAWRKADTPLDVILAIYETAQDERTKWTKTEASAKGRKRNVYRLVRRGRLLVELQVDAKTNHLVKLKVDDDPHGRKQPPTYSTATVDYPKVFPADIYALGAPKAAKVIDRTGEKPGPKPRKTDPVETLLAALRASRSTKWVHSVVTTGTEKGEIWMSFQPFRRYHRCERGKQKGQVWCMDPSKHMEAKYDPETQTLTIDYFDTQGQGPAMSQVMQARGMWGYLEVCLAEVRAGGGEVTETVEELNGKKHRVISVRQGEAGETSRLYIDMQTNRIVQAREHGAVNRLDYPKTGPKDIYDVGVPFDAKVLDRRPSKDLIELVRTVRAEAGKFPTSYVAVRRRELDRWFGEGRLAWPVSVTVWYVQGDRCRRESYRVRWPADQRDSMDWADEAVPAGSLDGLLAWAAQRKPHEIVIAQRGEGVTTGRTYSRDEQTGQLKTLRRSPRFAKLLLNPYHRPLSLQRLRRLRPERTSEWGEATVIETARPFERKRWCLLPEKDHVCYRYVKTFEGQGGPALSESWRVVTFAKTRGGRTYPSKERRAVYVSEGTVRIPRESVLHTFIDEQRKIDPALFDAESITAESLAR